MVSDACYVRIEKFLCNIYFSNSRNHNDLKFLKSYQNALQQAWKTGQINSVVEAMMSFHFGWLTVVCPEVKCMGYTWKSSQLHWARK